MAKLFASNIAEAMVSGAIQTLGGHGYLPADAAVLKSLNFTGAEREPHVRRRAVAELRHATSPRLLGRRHQACTSWSQRVYPAATPTLPSSLSHCWDAAATNDRIKDLRHEEDITGQTRAALVNSVYWKGRWAAPFQAAGTKLEGFLRLNGNPLC